MVAPIYDNVSDADAKEVYDTAVEEIMSKYETATVEDFDAAIATIKSALVPLAKAQTTAGADMTAAIYNPYIDGTDGWTIERPFGGNGPLLGGAAFEYWAGNASSRTDASFDYYQIINGLPNGIYTVSAEMYNSLNNEEGATFAASSGVYAKSGETEVSKLVDVDGTTPTRYTTDQITVTDGTLRIGVKSTQTMAARWFVADNFQLTLVKYIKKASNLDFGEDAAVEAGICTYQKDMATNNTTLAQAQSVTGWTIADGVGITQPSNDNKVGDAVAAGTFAYGAEPFLGGAAYKAPAIGPTSTNGKALGLVAVWKQKVQYTQTVTLPAGSHTMVALVYNAGGSTAFNQNLIRVNPAFGESVYAQATTYAEGQWTVEKVAFTLDEMQDVELSLGYKAANAGSGEMPKLFIDRVEIIDDAEAIGALETVTVIDNAKIKKLNALAKCTPVGDALFMYSQAKIDAAAADIKAATTVAEVEAVEMPTMITPGAEKRYSIQLKDGGNYLSIDGSAIKLAASEKPFTFEATETGYAIKSGDNYVAFSGTGNNWSMSATANAYSWTITALADGYYRITKFDKAADGIGVDNTGAGSLCYANKQTNDGDKALWTIAESHAYAINVAETENGTVTVASSAIAEEKVALTVTPDENYSVETFKITYTVPAAAEGEEPTEKEVAYTVNEETGAYEFTMPAYDVNIAATFTTFYVTVNAPVGNGTVTADHEAALSGSTVTLTITPEKNWAIDKDNFKVYYNKTVPAVEEGAEPTTEKETITTTLNAETGAYEFTMPQADVFVDVTFRSLGTAYDETLTKWRDATAELAKKDADFPGKIYTTDVEDLMNAANKALVEAKELLDKEEGANAAQFDALVAQASKDVDDALALAAKNYLLPTGEFYFKTTYNGNTYYLGPSNKWGTQASLISHSVAWTVTKRENGAYNLESQVSNGDKSWFFNGTYCDGKATDVVVAKADDKGGFYLSVGDKYLTVEGTDVAQLPIVANTANAAENAIVWTRVSTAAKNIKQYDDVTYLIKDADFGRNNRNTAAWTKEGTVSVNTTNKKENGELENQEKANFVTESWKKTFSVSQQLTGLPKGYYTLSFQGFYRVEAKAENDELPYVFANDEQVVPELITGTAINNCLQAGNAFNEGRFVQTIPVYVGEDGTLTIGVKSTKDNKWVVFDNFGLKFMGSDFSDFTTKIEDAYNALVNKHEAAQTTIAGLPDFAGGKNAATKKTIDAAIKAVTTAIRVDEVKDDKGKVTTPASGIYYDIKKAKEDKKLVDQKETLLAAIKAQSDAVDAYLKIATDLNEGNTKAEKALADAYEKLVAQWQDAFDQINTKWKDENDKDLKKAYNEYLKQLNSLWVDVDALYKTIKGYETAKTSQANQAKTEAEIKQLSEDIEAVLKNAYNLYNSEVLAANQASLKEVTDAADKLVEKYKDAVEVINSHYASNHTESAKKAQSDLFDLYAAVRKVQSDAIAKFTRINEANAAAAKDTKTFPTFEYFDDNYPTVADFIAQIEAIETSKTGDDNIATILATEEAAAVVENQKEFERYMNEVLGSYGDATTKGELAKKFNEAVATIKAIDRYNAGKEDYIPLATVYADEIAEIESAFDDVKVYIKKFNPHEKHEVKDSDPTFTCIFANSRKIDAKVDELEALIDALAAKVKKDLESNRYAQLQLAIAEVQEVLDEKVANLATYADDIQEQFAGAYDPAAADLKALKEAVEAANADGTIDAKADEFLAQIGNNDGKAVVLYPYPVNGPLTSEMFHEWSTSAAGADITGSVPNIYVENHIGEEGFEGTLYGDGNVSHLGYAALTDYETLVITLAEGSVGTPRLLFGRLTNQGPEFTEVAPGKGVGAEYVNKSEDGLVWTIDLNKVKADREDGLANLNVIKIIGGKVTVSSIELTALTNETIYEKIFAVSIPAENENAYDERQEQIADLKEQLETLKDVIEELGAEVADADLAAIADAIENDDPAKADLAQLVEESYKVVALIDDAADLDEFVEDNIAGPMADIYDDIYRDDLKDQLLAVKTAWENAYAGNTWPKNMDCDADQVWQDIVAFEEDILDPAIKYDTPAYEEACDLIKDFNLIFTDYEAWIEKFITPGDVNLDGEITISDVVLAAQNALAEEEDIDGLSKRQFFAADANGDKDIDQSDIVAIVNDLLAEEEEDEVAAKRRVAEIAEANDFIVVDGKNVSLENTTTFVAFTIEATAANGADVKVQLSERAKGLTVMTKKMKNGNTRIMAYSMLNTPITDTTGIILTADSDITVTYANFSDTAAASHILTVLTGEEYATGIASVEAGQDVDGAIYTIGGAKVNTLQKGVNIVKYSNGTVKKIYVK